MTIQSGAGQQTLTNEAEATATDAPAQTASVNLQVGQVPTPDVAFSSLSIDDNWFFNEYNEESIYIYYDFTITNNGSGIADDIIFRVNHFDIDYTDLYPGASSYAPFRKEIEYGGNMTCSDNEWHTVPPQCTIDSMNPGESIDVRITFKLESSTKDFWWPELRLDYDFELVKQMDETTEISYDQLQGQTPIGGSTGLPSGGGGGGGGGCFITSAASSLFPVHSVIMRSSLLPTACLLWKMQLRY